MKLVIHTQCRENYAAHTGFDGTYRWKNKGGAVYVVPNLTEANASNIRENGIPNLIKLIESRNEYSEEYVLGYQIIQNEETDWEYWEAPVMLVYQPAVGWTATRTNPNTDGLYARPIAEKSESWVLAPGGERRDYRLQYRMRTGELLSYDELSQYMDQYYQKEDAA